MYSGIVEGIGAVKQIETLKCGKHICIIPDFDFSDLKIGDSIAVNGTCLTITQINQREFHADIVQETLNKTNLGNLKAHDPINLERCMRVGDRIGGHFIKGHVDSVSEIIKLEKHGVSTWLTIAMPKKWHLSLVPKGSIAIDGMSITIVDVTKEFFTVTLIPHTITHTIAQFYQVGSLLNLEIDVLAKQIFPIVDAFLQNIELTTQGTTS